MNFEELLQQLRTLTNGKAMGVHVFHIAERGFLACLTDTRGEMIPQTMIWEYAFTLDDAIAGLVQIARTYGEAAIATEAEARAAKAKAKASRKSQ